MSEPRRSQPCGFRSLTLLVIANMVGAGVFTTSGFTLAAVGTPARVLQCWIVGALIAVCGAIAYGRLAKIIPESGGEYLYLSRFVHPFAGFLAGWISLTAGFSGAIAAVALTFERYAVPDVLRPVWLPADSIALTVIAICGLWHGIRVGFGWKLQNLVVVLQLAALAAFLAMVARNGAGHSWHVAALPDFQTQGRNLVTAMAISVVWISLSFAGFNSAIYVASESANAIRSVPAAILTGTVAVSCLYLLMNAIFVTAVPAQELAGQADVAAIAGKAIGGAALESVVRLVVALGLLSSVSGMIVTGPRVYQKMADDNVFPRWFAGLRGMKRSVGLQCALAASLIVVHRLVVRLELAESSLSQLLTFLGSTLSLSSAACVATLLLPTVRDRGVTRSRIVTIAVVVYVTATLASVVLMAMSHEINGVAQGIRHLTGTATVLVTGTVAWCLLRRR